jgi:hypothetical protein
LLAVVTAFCCSRSTQRCQTVEPLLEGRRLAAIGRAFTVDRPTLTG